jgi:hypothetical protein
VRSSARGRVRPTDIHLVQVSTVDSDCASEFSEDQNAYRMPRSLARARPHREAPGSERATTLRTAEWCLAGSPAVSGSPHALPQRRRNGSINLAAARRAKQPRFSHRQPLGRLPQPDTMVNARSGWRPPTEGRPPAATDRRLLQLSRVRGPFDHRAAAPGPTSLPLPARGRDSLASTPVTAARLMRPRRGRLSLALAERRSG